MAVTWHRLPADLGGLRRCAFRRRPAFDPEADFHFYITAFEPALICAWQLLRSELTRPSLVTAQHDADSGARGRIRIPDSTLRGVDTFDATFGSRTVLFRLPTPMKFLIALLLWSILFVLSWPVALLLVFVWPILWLLSIPFRIVGALMDAVVSLLRCIFFLPTKLLGP